MFTLCIAAYETSVAPALTALFSMLCFVSFSFVSFWLALFTLPALLLHLWLVCFCVLRLVDDWIVHLWTGSVFLNAWCSLDIWCNFSPSTLAGFLLFLFSLSSDWLAHLSCNHFLLLVNTNLLLFNITIFWPISFIWSRTQIFSPLYICSEWFFCSFQDYITLLSVNV